jgi:Lrp/AsnC family transcriptional regulator, leucine-responsive regulatory protein
MKSSYVLDRYELRILEELQRDGRQSHAELGRKIGLSPTAVKDRVRDLQDAGVISGYSVIIDPRMVGLSIVAMVTMTCEGDKCSRLATEVAAIPEVIECHRLTGDASALLKIVTTSIADLEVLIDRLARLGKPSTAIVLSTPLASRSLPIASRG